MKTNRGRLLQMLKEELPEEYDVPVSEVLTETNGMEGMDFAGRLEMYWNQGSEN